MELGEAGIEIRFHLTIACFQLRAACLDAINDISSSINAVISPKPAPPPPAPVPVVAALSTPMRRLAPTLPAKVEELTPATTAAPSNLHSLVTARLEALKTRPFLSAIFHSTPDHGVRSVMCRSQAAIWAIDAITNIVAASVAEDRHVTVLDIHLKNLLFL